MSKIKWTKDFSVQNKDIDDQHKKWIKIYNNAHYRIMNFDLLNDKSNIGKDVLKEMIEFSGYHFSFEEQFMEKIGFAGIEEHKEKHKDFVKKLDKIALQMHQGILVLNSEIIKVVENWFVDHILIEDQKYVQSI